MDWSFGNIAPDSHPPEEAIAPGVVIGGRYQVVDVLGSGAQGEVLAANDLQLGRAVAVKLLKSHQDTPRERFLREGRLTASLTHPNVVSLLAGGVTPDGRPFLVLELLDDPVPLDVYVRDEPLDVRMRLFADVCRGVGAAHSAGVVHRDLKPSNLLVDRHGHVRVCDFGLSVHQHEEAALTQTNTVVGTPLYMSPEALLGTERNRSPQQDVWSLGVLLYQLLTDSLPFECESLSELYAKITSGARPPSGVRAVPRDLERVCLRCLRRDPKERFPNGAAVAAAVQAASLVEVRRPWPPALRALALGALVAGAWLTVRQWPSTAVTPPTSPAQPPPKPPFRFPATDAEYVALLGRALAKEDLDELRVLVDAGVARGHPDAYQVKGVMHEAGLGGPVDLVAAAECFKRAARGGSPRGLCSLAYALQEGRGVDRDLEEARRLYERAAKLGFALAHAYLGKLYMEGLGVEKDLTRAEEHLLASAEEVDESAFRLASIYFVQGKNDAGERWLRKAADREHPQAMYEFAVTLLEQQQTREGLEWLRRSAEKGWHQAEVRLGSIYLDGQLLPKDLSLALEWVRRAAEHSALGKYNLGVFYERGYGVAPDPVLARELFTAAAEGGEVTAMLKLFHVLLEGRGGAPNPVGAHRWLRKAAETGSSLGCGLLGKRIMLGRTPDSIDLDPRERLERALPWLVRAARTPRAESYYDLGYCLAKLDRTEEAVARLRQAAQAGFRNAYSTLGEVLCMEGKTRDTAEAMRWFRKAAEEEHPRALLGIGRILEGEFGDPPDYAGARAAYDRAVAAGSRGAMFRLGRLLKGDQGGPPDVARGRALLERALEGELVAEDKDPTFVAAIEELLADYPAE